MKTLRHLVYLSIAILFFNPAFGQNLSPTELLGRSVFMDEDLSLYGNQSCASCHGGEAGWTGPASDINQFGSVYEGSIAGEFGDRKPPSAAYATQSPIFAFHRQGGGLFIGGNFWDGRATGEILGNPAAEQAQGPFLNPAEQALPDSACVVYFVCIAAYPVTLEDVYPGACDIDWPADIGTQCAPPGASLNLDDANAALVATAYDDIAFSIAAYEASSEVNAFTSKYDAYLAGLADLNDQEKQGMKLFNGKGKCSRCHTSKAKKDQPPLFTDYSFDNLGVPRNVYNPVYDTRGLDWVDKGLGGFLAFRPEYAGMAEENEGSQKVPTLRNVDLRPNPAFVKAFTHNGYFKTLKGIVHFYNTRDVKSVCDDPFTTAADAMDNGCWPEAEFTESVNDDELGNLKLSDEQEDAIVAFLKTLSDGYMIP
jgi:cytochrome c peroxidase